MSLLLDTHAALWYALDDSRLSPHALEVIENEPQQVFLRPTSYWKIAIKIKTGAYTLLTPFEHFWHGAIEDCGLSILHIEISHAAKVIELPSIHRDPFDRMIVAQSLVENISIVSCDTILDGYNIRRIW